MKRIAIVGAGGFAREVALMLRDLNAVRPSFEFAGYVVSDLSKLGEHDERRLVIGDFDALSTGVDAVVFGIGNPQVKLRLGAELSERFPALEWPTLIHPTARFDSESATIGRGVVIAANVIGTVNLTFNDYAMVNLSCTIGHEAFIGAGVVINPGANISGGVRLEAGVLVGTGAQILQYKSVGANAVVGAGAVVSKDVPPGEVVIGVPARPRQAEG